MTLLAGTRLGSYEITAALGAGGMGEVYRARDAALNRDVAIKVLPPALAADSERLARFKREAQILASLNHPNIAAIFGMEVGAPLVGALDEDRERAGTRPAPSDPTVALVMELVEGEDLSDRLRRGALPLDEALPLAIQIAEGLENAHEHGVIHRDLKPANIKLTPDGNVKILDFGLAKALEGDPASSAANSQLSHSPTMSRHMTEAGMIMGTAAYMSPEQARGKATDKRSDIWSFGVVLFEMLAGKRLFHGETVSDVLADVLKAEIGFGPLPAETPAAVRRVLRLCLDRNPKNRLHDIADARLILEEPSGGTADGPAGPTSTRRAWLLGAGAALPALALGWLGGRSGVGSTGATTSPSVTYKRLTFQPGNFVNARFAPDGQTAFLTANWRGPVREIFQVRPDGGELPIGVKGCELIGISREGELAILLPRAESGNPWNFRGTLAVVSSGGGTPRELAEDVIAADWLPDGKGFAALREIDGRQQIEFPLGKPVYRLPSRGYRLRVSPTGDAVAFFERSSDGGNALVVVDRNGRREVWSSGWADWWGLAWSPDGSEIWFSASAAGVTANVYATDRKGTVRTLLTAPGTLDMEDVARDGTALVARVAYSDRVLLSTSNDPTTERDLTWLEASVALDLSADGRHVLLGIQSEREPGQVTAFLRPTDGSAAIRLGYGWPQQLSHDGRFAVAIRGETLVVMPTGAGAERTIETGLPDLISARWLPGDAGLVFVGRDHEGSTVVRVSGLGGGEPRDLAAGVRLRSLSYYNRPVSPVSPDGGQIAVSVDGGVALLPLDGAAPQTVPGSEPSDQPLQWSVDGRRLHLFDPRELPSRLVELDLATGRRRSIAEVGPADLEDVAGITSALVTPDLSVRVITFQRVRSDLYRVEGLR